MKMITSLLKKGVLFASLAALLLSVSAAELSDPADAVSRQIKTYDLVIENGRVIDPETGRDEVATVAVADGVIERISAEKSFKPKAEKVIDASGLVVSPGFINTHTHEGGEADTEKNLSPATRLMVHDGVTFWLGGNCGMSPTGVNIPFDDEGNSLKRGDPDKSLATFLDEAENVPLYNHYGTLTGNLTLRSNAGLRHMEKESDEDIEKMKDILDRDLAAGSFGVSYGVMYDMGTTKKSMVELARVSEDAGGMAASHTRYPTFNLNHLFFGLDNVVLKSSICEAIDTCRKSGVPFIVSHITDMAQSDSARWTLDTIDHAIREESLPLVGDIIGHDYLGNDFYVLTFKGKLPIWFMLKLGDYEMEQFYVAQDVYVDGELYLEKYGQVTLEEAEFLRKNMDRVESAGDKPGLGLICRIIPPKDTKLALSYPWVFIGNDHGGRVLDPETGELDPRMPRGLGTFSRLLGHWSRQEGALTMKQALFKATIAPAMWLGLDQKGRLQKGCDADIVVFDPDTVIDRARWLHDKEHLKPKGISYVIVNGEVVTDHGEPTGNTPGRVIRRTWEIPGNTRKVLDLYEERFKGNP
ncbi:MAG: amidohydrolase family protein [bacterium]